MIDFTYLLSTIENEEEYETAERIFTEHRDFMYKIAWSYLKNDSDAEDLVMEVAANICANISAFVGKANGDVERMILRYTKNAASNRYREKGRKKTQAIPENTEDEEKDFDETDLAVLIDKSHFGDLQRYVDKLSEQQRMILIYRYVDHLTCRKIAQMTGIPESTVSTQSGRALKKLAELYRKDNKRTIRLDGDG